MKTSFPVYIISAFKNPTQRVTISPIAEICYRLRSRLSPLGCGPMTTESSIGLNTCALSLTNLTLNLMLTLTLNPNPTTKQHAIVSIQLNIVTYPTCPDKFTRNNVAAPFFFTNIRWHCALASTSQAKPTWQHPCIVTVLYICLYDYTIKKLSKQKRAKSFFAWHCDRHEYETTRECTLGSRVLNDIYSSLISVQLTPIIYASWKTSRDSRAFWKVDNG